MDRKPVVLFNRIDEDGVAFWDPLIQLLEEQGVAHLVRAVHHLDEVLPAVVEVCEGDVG